MSRLIRFKWLVIALSVVGGLWLFSGRLIMELEWRPSSPEGFAQTAAALAAGQTGPVLKTDPCMANQTTIDLHLVLDGPFPIGLGRNVVMSVYLSSDALMVGQLYLGPPVHQLDLPGLPICIAGAALPTDADNDSWAHVIVQFTDLENRRFVTFQGDEAFPILAWRNARIQWANVPWYMERGQSYSQIMVTPGT
jgi:hypothetical protein